MTAKDWLGNSSEPDGHQAPALRILRGVPTAEELAALVGVLAARSAVAAPAPTPARQLWRRQESRIGARLAAGPGAWRASGLPR